MPNRAAHRAKEILLPISNLGGRNWALFSIEQGFSFPREGSNEKMDSLGRSTNATVPTNWFASAARFIEPSSGMADEAEIETLSSMSSQDSCS